MSGNNITEAPTDTPILKSITINHFRLNIIVITFSLPPSTPFHLQMLDKHTHACIIPRPANKWMTRIHPQFKGHCHNNGLTSINDHIEMPMCERERERERQQSRIFVCPFSRDVTWMAFELTKETNWIAEPDGEKNMQGNRNTPVKMGHGTMMNNIHSLHKMYFRFCFFHLVLKNVFCRRTFTHLSDKWMMAGYIVCICGRYRWLFDVIPKTFSFSFCSLVLYLRSRAQPPIHTLFIRYVERLKVATVAASSPFRFICWPMMINWGIEEHPHLLFPARFGFRHLPRVQTMHMILGNENDTLEWKASVYAGANAMANHWMSVYQSQRAVIISVGYWNGCKMPLRANERKCTHTFAVAQWLFHMYDWVALRYNE